MYRVKHVPTGLYYKPCGHRASHLSKTGKVYHTNVNGVNGEKNGGMKMMRIFCEKNSQIHKNTKDKLDWKDCSYSYNRMYTDTPFEDWTIENI
jgi:hypothetical protein